MHSGQACSGCSTDASHEEAVSAGQKGDVESSRTLLGYSHTSGATEACAEGRAWGCGVGWSQGSLRGVMSPQVWQDRSNRNSRMPQELQWCTLRGGRSRPCSQEEGQNGGCAIGQRRGRDLGLDSEARESEGQEDSWRKVGVARTDPGEEGAGESASTHRGGEK